MKELQRRGDPNVVIALAGNKCDMPDSKRKVQTEEAQQYANENEIIYIETSAKTSHNVRNLFVEIAKKLPKTIPVQEKDAFPIVPPKKDKKGCC